MQEAVIIGDGAMGTELWRRGFPHGLPPEQANLTAPDLVKSIHRDYLAVGVQVVTTNTFAANPFRLREFGLERQLKELVQASVRLAREAIAELGADASCTGERGC